MPAIAGTILRREHLVAACLVGTVVVVVGFASGLGINKPAAESPQAAQNNAMPPMSQGAEPGNPGAGGGTSGGSAGSGGVNYVGTPAGLAAAPVGSLPGVGVVTTPTSSATAPVTTTDSAPPTTSTTVAPPPTCESGLLTGLLNQAATAVNGLPVVGPLAPQLTGALLGSCSAQSTTDGSAPSTTPVAVPGLLPLLTPTGTGS